MTRKLKKRKGPFVLLGSREIYKNPWIRVREDKVIRPDGKRGIFGWVEMVPGVQVVAIDKQGYCYLTEEYHYGVDRTTIEVIAGGIDRGENPLEAAKREAFEEAGLVAKRWKFLGKFSLFSTLIYSPQHVFLALDAKIVTEPTGEEGKLLKIKRLPFKKALQMIDNNVINIGASMVAILKADYFLRSRRNVFKKSGN